MARYREKNFKNLLKRKLEGFFLKFGLIIKRTRKRGYEDFPEYIEDSFIQLYKKYCDLSMVPWQGMHDSYQAAKYLSLNSIEGEIVECGVYKGGCLGLISETINLFNKGLNDRKFYLFDTFEGMSDPTSDDYKIFEKDALYTLKRFKEQKREDGSSDNARGELHEVKDTILKANKNLDNFKFIKGMVETTLKDEKNIPEKIALLRLDTDFYESTKIELEILFSKLVKGGILIIDDYGHWSGANKATNQFFSKNKFKGISIFNNHINGSLIGIKI